MKPMKNPSPFIVSLVNPKLAGLEVIQNITDVRVESDMHPVLEVMNSFVIPRKDFSSVVMEEVPTEEMPEEPFEMPEQEESTAQDNPRKKKPKPTRDDEIIGNILRNIKEHPFIPVTERYEMLVLPPAKADRLVDEMEARGFIEKISFNRGYGTGGSILLLKITDYGFEYAKMKPFIIPGKGSLEHQYWQHKIKEYYENLDAKNFVEIEMKIGFKHVDVGIKKTDGSIIAVEVELTNSNLVSNVKEDIDNGVNHLIIAARAKRTLTNYEKTLKKHFSEEFINKLEFKILSEFLKEAP
jgi:hypothetical protein